MTLKREKYTSINSQTQEHFYAGKDAKIIEFNIFILQMRNLKSQVVCQVTELVSEIFVIKSLLNLTFSHFELYHPNFGKSLCLSLSESLCLSFSLPLCVCMCVFVCFNLKLKPSKLRYKFKPGSLHHFQKGSRVYK